MITSKSYRAAICAAFVAACSACSSGGSGGSSDTSKVIQTPPPVVKKVLIYADGDSTMYGAAPGSKAAESTQPAAMQATLQAVFGPSVTVENHAQPGQTVADSVNGTGTFTEPLAARLAKSNAQIVLCNFAINDSQKFTTSEYGENLAKWINVVEAAGKIPVFVEPNPTDLSLAPWTYSLSQYVAVMRYEADIWKVAIVPQFAYLQTLDNWKSMLSADGIHPLATMYQIMGERDAAALKPIVAARVS